MFHWFVCDIGLMSITALLVYYAYRLWHHPPSQARWAALLQNTTGRYSLIVCIFFWGIALLDSLHSTQIGHPSLLDQLFCHLQPSEQTYSPPFALFNTQTTLHQPPLPLAHIQPLPWPNILIRLCLLFLSMLALHQLSLLVLRYHIQKRHQTWQTTYQRTCAIIHPVFTILTLLAASWLLSQHYHILGTNKIGEDIFYQCLKSIRTGMVIALLTPLISLPIATLLGALAGYMGGKTDDVIQFIYTTLSAIPGVLLISAAVLTLQISMSRHPHWFASLEARADARLLALCMILALTGWPHLCRLIRAETLRIKQLPYIESARILGHSITYTIVQHIIPNVGHIILITAALDFSALVLAEAVLSYMGVGVDPTMYSWGNMINASRLELARTPIIWWPLVSAFGFMLTLVLSTNLLAERLQKYLQPPNH